MLNDAHNPNLEVLRILLLDSGAGLSVRIRQEQNSTTGAIMIEEMQERIDKMKARLDEMRGYL